MHVYIVAFLVSIILLIILFFALRSTVKRINYNVKKYFVDKLQDYDYLIEEKQRILDELNKKIEENNNNFVKADTTQVNDSVETNVISHKNYNMPKYVDKDLFKKYKSIKESFNFNYDEVIKNFIQTSLTSLDENYNTILNIRKKLTNDTIFKILSLREKEQINYIKNLFDSDERKIIIKFIEPNKFKIKKLVSTLDTYIEKNDPYIYVYTGDKNIDYNNINSKIKTVYDENINEGIKIFYKGILYDYSL